MYDRFKEDREDANDDARTGHPKTLTSYENIETVKKINLNNRQITIKQVANDVDKSCGSEDCSRIAEY